MQELHLKRNLSETLVAFGGLAVLTLMLLGVGGTIYKVLAPDGWMTALLKHGLPDSLAASTALLVMCAFAWLTREWRTPRTKSGLMDLLVYALAGAGLWYAAQLLMHGGL